MHTSKLCTTTHMHMYACTSSLPGQGGVLGDVHELRLCDEHVVEGLEAGQGGADEAVVVGRVGLVRVRARGSLVSGIRPFV